MKVEANQKADYKVPKKVPFSGEDMYYLDGYLSFVFNDEDLMDAAWFEAQVALIMDHWGVGREKAHDAFLNYLQWKNERI